MGPAGYGLVPVRRCFETAPVRATATGATDHGGHSIGAGILWRAWVAVRGNGGVELRGWPYLVSACPFGVVELGIGSLDEMFPSFRRPTALRRRRRCSR